MSPPTSSASKNCSANRAAPPNDKHVTEIVARLRSSPHAVAFRPSRHPACACHSEPRPLFHRGEESAFSSHLQLFASAFSFFISVYLCSSVVPNSPIQICDLTRARFLPIILSTLILSEEVERLAGRPEIYLRNGRRGFFPWQGRGGGLHGLPARKPRTPSHPPEVRS